MPPGSSEAVREGELTEPEQPAAAVVLAPKRKGATDDPVRTITSAPSLGGARVAGTAHKGGVVLCGLFASSMARFPPVAGSQPVSP